MMRMFSVLVNSMMRQVKLFVLTSIELKFAPTLLRHTSTTCKLA
jgi:hypothetical protein